MNIIKLYHNYLEKGEICYLFISKYFPNFILESHTAPSDKVASSRTPSNNNPGPVLARLFYTQVKLKLLSFNNLSRENKLLIKPIILLRRNQIYINT